MGKWLQVILALRSAFQRSKRTGQAEFSVRGIKDGKDRCDLDGVVKRRPRTPTPPGPS